MAIEFKGNASVYLLVAGAALGLGAAMWSALGVGQSLAPYGDAVAIVDGTPISRTVYDSAIEGLVSAKRNPLTDTERREALDRIIDEELLLHRALELGLGESDPPSRKALVNAMLQFSIAEASKRIPTDAELVRFYAERPKLISPQPLLTVRAVSFSHAETNKAQTLRAAIDSGAGFDAAVKQSGAEGVLLPGGSVIPAKIAEYAGGTIRDTALALAKGHTAGPIAIGDRLVFVHLVDRTETPPPPLDAVRDVVAEEWQKREAEKAFADYVDGLRRRARISYGAGTPAAGTN
ncbi:MAG: peptidyl-prolyl cis-trans isomerase [Micropepsaceae bacterium]